MPALRYGSYGESTVAALVGGRATIPNQERRREQGRPAGRRGGTPRGGRSAVELPVSGREAGRRAGAEARPARAGGRRRRPGAPDTGSRGAGDHDRAPVPA